MKTSTTNQHEPLTAGLTVLHERKMGLDFGKLFDKPYEFCMRLFIKTLNFGTIGSNGWIAVNTVKRIIKYVLYTIFTNAVYGLILYNLCTWLAGYSLLYAYLGNFTLIILGLTLDELYLKMFQSKWLVKQIKKEKDNAKNFNVLQFVFDSFISFKTILYVFYILIMIFSEIIDLKLVPMNKDLENFIFANRYSILLLIALDQLIGQFSKDRERIKGISEKFKKHWTENEN